MILHNFKIVLIVLAVEVIVIATVIYFALEWLKG